MNKTIKVFCILIMQFVNHPGSSQTVDQPYEIGTWHDFRKAAVSFTFDDNCPNQYSVAIPMFNEFHFKFTLFTVTGSSWVWPADWHALQNAAAEGHEIGSHTVTHRSFADIDDSQEAVELRDSQNQINTNIPSQKCITIAYPSNIPGNKSICRQYYIAARSGSNAIESSTPPDIMTIGSFNCGTLGPVKTSDDFISMTRSAIGPTGWCVYMLHGIDNDGGWSPVTTDVLRQTLQYFNQNRNYYWVETFGHVVLYIQERDAASVKERSVEENRISLQVTDPLDNDIFNHSISIRRPLPQGWTSASVTQNGQTVDAKIIQADNVRYVQFDAVPDNGEVVISKEDGMQIPQPPFLRGFNLANWFENFSSVATLPFKLYTREDFENIKSLGCDHVRVPVEFFDGTGPAPGYTLDPLLFFLLDQVIDWAEALGLYIIIDNHSWDPLVDTDPEIEDQLLAVWRQVADRYKNRSHLICYEILNEPHGISDSVWHAIQQKTIDAIRQFDDIHTIIVGPANWNHYDNLSLMPQFTGGNLIYTFHFYDPYIFTHQGTTWGSPPMVNLVGVPYPYNVASMPGLPADLRGTWIEDRYHAYPDQGNDAWVRSQIDIAVQFMNERHVPIWCGEFGAHMPGSNTADRARWLRTVRTCFEDNNISWAHHEYRDGFGIFEPESHELFEYDVNIPIIEALGLNPPPQSEYRMTAFTIYDDYVGQGIIFRNWLSGGHIDFYSQSHPAEGDFCISWQGANLYDCIGFEFFTIYDLTQLVENDYLVDMWVRGTATHVKFDIRFVDTDTDDPDDHPWRMRFTIDNTVVDWDGTWQHVQIPLSDFTEHGAYEDSTWYNPQGDFDWSQVEHFGIDAQHHDLIDVELFFDHICITVPPSADFSASQTSGTAPLTVQFTSQSSGDITRYLWDFGDGGTSTVENPSHTYQILGLIPLN